MDEIESLCIKVNGKFACKKCKHCTNRYDNLKRHIEEKHLKIKVTCECGKTMTKSALSRHKRSTCNRMKQSDESHVIEEHIVHSFKIKLIKSADGSVSALHDAINVDGYLFNLVPIKSKIDSILNF